MKDPKGLLQGSAKQVRFILPASISDGSASMAVSLSADHARLAFVQSSYAAAPEVHAGALGWVAMISVGAIYAMLPRLLGASKMYSTKWIDTHFWLHTMGVVFYIASMWIAGVMQGLMWRATNPDGTLTYSFVEALNATYPYYLVRFGGGALVLAGMLLMAWNTWKTYATAKHPAANTAALVQPAA